MSRGLPAKESPNLYDRTLQNFYFILHSLRDVVSPLAEDARPLWRDYSYWNGEVDGSVAAAHGVYGGFGRAGIAGGYPDPTFENFWNQYGQYELYRSSYLVIHTDKSVDNQIKNWYTVHPKIEIIPKMIDLQVNRGDDVSHKAEVVWAVSNEVLERDGVRPIIYSRRLLINEWLKSWTTDMLNSHYYMLAQYLTDPTKEHPGPPTLPNRVRADHVLWQQTADTFPGFPGEVDNKAVDRDRWLLGNANDMETWIQRTWNGQAPPPPSIPIAMRVTGSTNIRSSKNAAISSNIIGYMLTGSVWPIPAVEYDSSGRMWAKVAANVYFATWVGELIYSL